MKRPPRPALLLLAMLVLACPGGDQRALQAGAVPVDRYMECDECVDAELAAVRALGDTAVPLLRQYLLHGPPPTRVTRRHDLLLVWQARVQHDSAAALGPLAEKLLGNYTLRYRRRSANALKAIGTPNAQAALCAAGVGPC